MIKVSNHKRKGRAVRKHMRKPDKWGARPNSGMEYGELQRKLQMYTAEFNALSTGQRVSSPGHRAFIVRRMRAAGSALRRKKAGK